MANIVALEKEIEAEDTGALTRFHVIEFYSVDLKYRTATATLNSYVSREKYEQGRNALAAHTLDISGLPETVYPDLSWLYRQAALPESGSVFADARLVEGDVPLAGGSITDEADGSEEAQSGEDEADDPQEGASGGGDEADGTEIRPARRARRAVVTL